MGLGLKANVCTRDAVDTESVLLLWWWTESFKEKLMDYTVSPF